MPCSTIAVEDDPAGKFDDFAGITDAFESVLVHVVDPGFGHNEIHGHVVRLRTNRCDPGQLECHADLERLRCHDGEGPIKVAAAVTQPVTLRVKTNRRDEQGLRANHGGAIRHWQVEHAFGHRRPGPPFAELKRRPFLHHDRERSGGASRP